MLSAAKHLILWQRRSFAALRMTSGRRARQAERHLRGAAAGELLELLVEIVGAHRLGQLAVHTRFEAAVVIHSGRHRDNRRAL